MNDFSKQLAHASRPTMESVIENSEKCQRSVSKLLIKFEDMGISSVPTNDKETPFLQSLNTLLGFLRRVRRKRLCINIYAGSPGGRRCFGMGEMI